MEAPAYFEVVRRKAARRWEQLDADPELAAPWRQLFLQVQSPRHVVSELLQNADDAGATEAAVRISDGTFIFEHNGQDFREEEFLSLCRFGYSNKRSLHTIGHRGIGFKSTFSLGDTVELLTPTLSVFFHKDRFTLPQWNRNEKPSRQTRIIVAFGDERRRRELQTNIDDWEKNVVSLLFFRNIRALKIDGETIRWESLGSGSPDNSEWFRRSDAPDSRVLLVRAAPEAFPNDALAEIRRERMLSDDEALDFPPSSVEIVLGAKGELFVVLPTRVSTACPFASNAPFIQDPAREGIKDPNISPTNRWLLERIGRLAGNSMLQWLSDSDLPDEQRAAAYDLLPPETSPGMRPLDESVAETIRAAFAEGVDDEKFILGFGGQLYTSGAVTLIPETIRAAWPDVDTALLFDGPGRVSLADCVSSVNAEKLVSRGSVKELERSPILWALRDKEIPKPQSWSELLSLWTFVTQDSSRVHYFAQTYRELHLVPVQGDDVLHKCASVVRLGETRSLQSDDDWAFIAPYLRIMDQGWAQYLALQSRSSANDQEAEVDVSVSRANDLLRALNLGEAADASRLIEQVCVAMFSGSSARPQDAIHLAWIAANFNANVGKVMEYVTIDESIQETTEELVFDRDGTASALLPEDWCKSHVLSRRYLDLQDTCPLQVFSDWASSDRSGLTPFPAPNKIESSIYSRSDVTVEMRRRGLSESPEFRYKSHWFSLLDWDYTEELWEYWAEAAIDDPEIYAKVMDRELVADLNRLRERAHASIMQNSQGGNYRNPVSRSPMLPSWILKMREFPCLRDTNGVPRKPSELMRRTEATEPFLGIDPFVQRSLDTEAAASLLDMLGVQTHPQNPEKILERVRALSFSPDPPIAELESLYRRLDMICASCSTDELASTRQLFESEALVFTESGEWRTALDAFVQADEEDVPGVAVVRSSMRDLAMWPRLGVAQRPTLGLAIEWLSRLPCGTSLDAATRRRIRALLSRYPNEVWTACGHWLTLTDTWEPTATLRWHLSMQSLVPETHLFSSIRSEVANFRMLSVDILAAAPFSDIPTLASCIREEISGEVKVLGELDNQEWLREFGGLLAYAQFDDADVTERVSALATELMATRMIRVDGLKAVPFIGGVPAGSTRPVNALWSARSLYVADRPAAKLAEDVVKELGRFFDRTDIADALRMCFERSTDFIAGYFEENFVLGDHLPEAAAKPMESSAIGAISVGGVNGRITSTLTTISEVPGPHREESSPAEPTEPRSRPRRRIDLFERFAVSQGFEKISSQRYEAEDGRCLEKIPDSIFPWKLRSPGGEMEKEYWVLDRSLDAAAIEVPSEVWELAQRRPENTVFVLADVDGTPTLLAGQTLVDLHRAGELTLQPASYRLQKKSG